MKIIPKNTPKAFQPIVVEITIESEAELFDLWHRTNISLNQIRDTVSPWCTVPVPPSCGIPPRGVRVLWEFLDTCVKASGGKS